MSLNHLLKWIAPIDDRFDFSRLGQLRKRLQRAYQEPTSKAAKERLLRLHAELAQINRKAGRSLRKGLEQTLTLHRLGLFEDVAQPTTTAGIEKLMGQV
jgi:hypothetical protein